MQQYALNFGFLRLELILIADWCLKMSIANGPLLNQHVDNVRVTWPSMWPK